MELLVDAQLPQRMTDWFQSHGCNALHTLSLPEGNRSSDAAISNIADENIAILVTKDSDFVDSHLIHNSPRRLILISTGNISNRELEQLLRPLIPQILTEMRVSNFIEVGRNGITSRG
jgi:predicted nuclease of predicted toxin-antitoxin system